MGLDVGHGLMITRLPACCRTWLVINALITPSSGMMGVVGAAALATNLVCFAMPHSHRGDNLNMSSTWLYSRNDLFANGAVLGAAGAAYLLQPRWPGVAAGVVIALLGSASALRAPWVAQITQLKRPV